MTKLKQLIQSKIAELNTQLLRLDEDIKKVDGMLMAYESVVKHIEQEELAAHDQDLQLEQGTDEEGTEACESCTRDCACGSDDSASSGTE